MSNLPAVFLDRDGTLIEDVGILSNPEDVRIFPDTLSSLRKLQSRYRLFVITNQPGISRKLVSIEQVRRVNEHIAELLRAEDIRIEEWFVCPHQREELCSCIKPKSAFVVDAAKRYSLDLQKSFVIGDHPHDALTANELGVFGVYLLTGHGAKHLNDLPWDKLVFHRLEDAADWILSHPSPQSISQQIRAGAEAIREGKTVAFPTETVYGLGADAFNPSAVSRVFEIKKRPTNNPLIVHVSAPEQAELVAAVIPDSARRLTDAFWPGPLTIVLPKKEQVPSVVTGGYSTVAIRMPASPVALELIRQAETPIAAPSANAFSCTSPTTAHHVREQLGSLCDVIIDGGACRVGVESTVVSFTGAHPVVLRPGGISIEDIEAVIGSVHTIGSQHHLPAESPGLMPNHYAPQTPLSLLSQMPADYAEASDIGVLLFQPNEMSLAGPVEILSRDGDVAEAAVNLYAAIRRLDSLGLSQIIAIKAPDHGLGKAINNRLEKASGGRVK